MRVDGGSQIHVDPWPIPAADKPRRNLRVGVILDDFSALALGYEWNQIPLLRQTWRQQLESAPIDLLFIESAWHGNSDSWQYCLAGPSAPAKDLAELITWCKTAGVPTVFWNKEDPIHFDDFIETAKLFDHVFTTDANQIGSYREALGHDRIGVMPFAAQEKIHNPIRPRTGYQHRDVSFAGMYFAHRHPERREQMDLLLNAAADVSPRMPHGLEIFSRYLGSEEKYQFPKGLAERVVGSLDYKRMLTAYRMYKVFLNVNTVVDSPTMCARRIFEITASGTPVVTTPSKAIEQYFDGSMVVQVGDREQAGFAIRALVNSEELRSAQTHRAQRQIWQRHTYSHRVNDVLEQLHLPQHIVSTRASVSMLASTNRPHQLEHILRTAGAQRGVEKQLLLLTHGFEADTEWIRSLADEMDMDMPVLLTAPSDLPLGACLNLLADAADGDLVAKIDDDDFYGPHYLADQASAMNYSGADVVGKQAHYVQFDAQEVTAIYSPEREHRFTDFIPGPTIFSRASTIQELRFPELMRGEDSGLLDRVRSSNGTIYSSDRFQFVRFRQAPGGAGTHTHTWNASDWNMLANARVAYLGTDTAPAMN